MTDWIDNIESAWTGHRKFAEALVKDYGVETAIELGVDRGYSLFVFANAGVKMIYGIDLWEPYEPHPEWNYDNYLPLLQQQLAEHNLIHNVNLIKGDFNEVVKTWSYGAVDVLHIDGTHIYEHVKADFENWLPFVKDDGLVLMHDVCVPHFTVKEFFNEITLPKAWFAHSFGLGVVCRNEQKLHELKKAFPDLNFGNVPL